eukprot:s204_g29.t1
MKKLKERLSRIIEEEMKLLLDDPPELAAEELHWVAKMKKMLQEPTEEEEILQTKVISTREAARSWNEWLPAIDEEVQSLLQDKEALKKISKKELEEIKEEASKKGKSVEIIPSKLVFTLKAGPNGGRKKARWVICGNYEAKKDSEQNFSSGADSAAFRISVWAASRHQWSGAVIDIKTAFLNAEMEQGDQEDVLLVRPPALFTEKGYMANDVFFLPLKAVYGLRRSPRLWGICRDVTMEEFEIEAEDEEGKKRKFHLQPLQSEPNLWRVLETGDESQKLWGLVMTYVDDIFICSQPPILNSIIETFQKTWKTSTPEHVTKEPVRFLGMEVSKKKEEKGGREEWYVTQRSYIKDLMEKSEEKVKERKIPVTKDQAIIEAPASPPTIDQVRGAQKVVGEVLWLLTRSRPDIMYGVSRMGSNVLKNPVKVMELGEQMKGYLRRTQEEGLRYQVDFKDAINLQAFSDASFAMTEVIEAMTAGESIAVIVQELYDLVTKTAYTDSQAAEAILTTDGRSWRTRHLKLRSSFARQSISRGEWLLQHVAGEQMLADIGTKALSAPRLEKLKDLMSMGSLKESEDEEEEKEDQREGKKKEAKELAKIAEAAQAVS